MAQWDSWLRHQPNIDEGEVEPGVEGLATMGAHGYRVVGDLSFGCLGCAAKDAALG